ncbi:MAG: 3-oxoacyl-ACP synthase III family protein [Actinomycetota bacterium]
MSEVTFAAISGWGMAVPERIVTNAELAPTVGADERWIVERTGIRERRIAGPDEHTSTLAVAAGRRAIESAGLAPEDLDLVIVATTTPDSLCPPTAALVQGELGATGAGAFDLNGACAGFLIAMNVGSDLIRAGSASRVLVVGADVFSRFLDWNEPRTCVLFGDGAGAIVLEKSDEPAGLVSVVHGADGRAAGLIGIQAGGSARPASHETVAAGEHLLRMNGPRVFRAAVRTMVAAGKRALGIAGLDSTQVDLLVSHQANQRIVEECGARLGIPPDRVFTNVAHYGNTSAASIPIAICEAAADRLAPGSKVLLTAVGAGLVWAAGVLEWSRDRTAAPEGRVAAAFAGASS